MLALYLQLKNWFDSEDGQDLIEYALIVALLVAACAATLTLTGTSITNMFADIQGWLDGIRTP